MNPGIIEALREQIKKAPSPRLYFQLAEDLRAAGNVQESIDVLKEGVARFPRYLSARISLGRALLSVRNHREAAEIMKAVLEEDPENVIAIRALAQAYEAMGQKVEAIKKYKLLRIFTPDDEELQGKIESLDQDLNPPATLKERKIKRLEAFLHKMEQGRRL